MRVTRSAYHLSRVTEEVELLSVDIAVKGQIPSSRAAEAD